MGGDTLSELKDMLLDKGLDVRTSDDICLLLKYKRHPVQAAFYFMCKGMTQEEIAPKVGVSHQQVSNYIKDNCFDIQDILQVNVCKTDKKRLYR